MPYLMLDLLPPANEVCRKVMLLHLSVILFTGGGGLPDRDLPWTESPLDRDLPGQRRPWMAIP